MAKQTRKRSNHRRDGKPNNNFEPQRSVKVTSVTYSDGITVAELAAKCHKNASEIIKILFMLSKMVTINSPLDPETVELVCLEFGIEPIMEEAKDENSLADDEIDDPSNLKERPPIEPNLRSRLTEPQRLCRKLLSVNLRTPMGSAP